MEPFSSSQNQQSLVTPDRHEDNRLKQNSSRQVLGSFSQNPQSQQVRDSSVILQTNVKDLKDNYQVIETQIVAETQKQRQDHQDRYSEVLDRIQTLKKLLKTEVENRKNTELHFKELIDNKAESILNQFTVQYLNKLHAMHETVASFQSRKAVLEERRRKLQDQVDNQLRENKEQIIEHISDKRLQFEQSYTSQVEQDVKELKYIGELEYNFSQMTKRIHTTRDQEYGNLKDQIDQILKSSDLYEREEATRKLLLLQVNQLKNCKQCECVTLVECKLEIESRAVSDKEIEAALTKYQDIISKQVSEQRLEIRK